MNDRPEADPGAVEDASRIPVTRRSLVRRALFAIIALLYLISVPWYRATDAPLRVVFGLPDWVAVAIGCYIAVAILNAIAWMLTTIPDEPTRADDSRPGTR